MTPCAGTNRVSSAYGWRTLNGVRQWHAGIDIVADDRRLRAIWDAVKVEAVPGWNEGRGNLVRVYYSPVLRVIYQHVNDIYVTNAAAVKQGDVIAQMGWSGNCVPQGPGGMHLHIEVQKMSYNMWTAVDPSPYIEVPNAVGRHPGNNRLDTTAAAAVKQAAAADAGTKSAPAAPGASRYKKGDRLTFTSGYARSTDGEEHALHVAKKQLLVSRGIVGDVLANGARNPLKMVAQDGKTPICWCNDGDISGRW